MNNTTTTWNSSEVTIVMDGVATTIVRLNNNEAEKLYNELSIRAANHDLFNKDGEFNIAGRIYELTAGQWASIYRTLTEWYDMIFDAFISDDVFGSATPVTLRAVK